MEAGAVAATAQVPYTWPSIAIVNDKSSGMSDAEVKPIVDALARQVLYDFGPRWHIGAHLYFVPAGSKPPAGMWAVALLDSSDQAGALGYHDLTPDGLPLGKVFCGTDRQYGDMISVTMSHEVLEMLGDPWISLAAQDDRGRFWAWETCDAVEADRLSYEVDGVRVSAFVCPGWFGSGDPKDIAFPVGVVTKPFELAPGGYMSVFDPSSGQGWQQMTAEQVNAGHLDAPSGMEGFSSADVYKALPRIGSRRERRFRGRSGRVLSTYEVG